MPPQIAAHGANNQSFHAMEITKMMMHKAPMMRLMCIIKRACLFSLGKLMTSRSFE